MGDQRSVAGAGVGRRKKYIGQSVSEMNEGIIDVRDLKIAWASDATQWNIHLATYDNNQTTENQSTAEALKVMWFEVKAKYVGAKPGSKYKIGFNISLKSDAFGWDDCPVFLMLKIGSSGSYSWRKLLVKPASGTSTSTGFDFPGDFEIEIPMTAVDTTLHFGLYEVWSGRWKGGLIIHHAFVKRVV